MTRVMPGRKNNLHNDSLRAIHETMFHGEIMRENDARVLGDLKLRGQAIEVVVAHAHAIDGRDAFVTCIDADHRDIGLGCHRTQVCTIVEVAIVFGVLIRGTT